MRAVSDVVNIFGGLKNLGYFVCFLCVNVKKKNKSNIVLKKKGYLTMKK